MKVKALVTDLTDLTVLTYLTFTYIFLYHLLYFFTYRVLPLGIVQTANMCKHVQTCANMCNLLTQSQDDKTRNSNGV